MFDKLVLELVSLMGRIYLGIRPPAFFCFSSTSRNDDPLLLILVTWEDKSNCVLQTLGQYCTAYRVVIVMKLEESNCR